MRRSARHNHWLSAILISILLSACGGGGGGGEPSNNPVNPSLTANIQEPSAPTATGDTATDGINRFNFRRQQMGLSVLTRTAKLDDAALGHSKYQAQNNTITHVQTEGKPGFTGVCLLDNKNDANCPEAKVSRLEVAAYSFGNGGYAAGEVIARSVGSSGIMAAEDLIAAIYHRFVIFEPMFKELGAGAAAAAGGSPTYFTTNFTANGLDGGIGPGRLVIYPFDGQQHVRRVFFSDNEVPDPVPDANEVGYPISVHADILLPVTVQSFTVRPRGGGPLPVYLLDGASDPHMTATSFKAAASIIPRTALAAATTYEVNFTGTVGGQNVTRAWTFTTQE